MKIVKDQNKVLLQSQKGVTLIELTVVIAILLVLISVLFIGASFYKDSADQAACVVNQSSSQKAFRAAQNLQATNATPIATLQNVVDAGAMSAIPVCPSTGANYAITTVGGVDVVACQDGTVGAAHNTAAGDKSAW